MSYVNKTYMLVTVPWGCGLWEGKDPYTPTPPTLSKKVEQNT